jgi:hypothetical protein
MGGWQALFCRLLEAGAGFAERPLSEAGNPLKIVLPVAAPGQTPPGGADGGAFLGVLGWSSR